MRRRKLSGHRCDISNLRGAFLDRAVNGKVAHFGHIGYGLSWKALLSTFEALLGGRPDLLNHCAKKFPHHFRTVRIRRNDFYIVSQFSKTSVCSFALPVTCVR